MLKSNISEAQLNKACNENKKDEFQLRFVCWNLYTSVIRISTIVSESTFPYVVAVSHTNSASFCN